MNGGRGVGQPRTPGPMRLVWLVASFMSAALALVGIGGLAVESSAVRSATGQPGSELVPLPTGPIMVLGGGEERVEAALALDAVRRDGRELIASARAGDDLGAFERSCAEPDIRCVAPDPVTTRGEARLAAQLARDEGWPALTVVTSSWHAHRAGRHFAACLDIPLRVLSVHYVTLETVPRRLLWREALGALDARLRPECRDRAP